MKRRLPALDIPLGQPEADAVADIAARAIESPDRGRVRALSFVCEGLGRLGGYRELVEEVFEALATEVSAGALTLTKRFVENHVTPSCLGPHPDLVATYNASLLLRNARFVLGESACGFLREWARQLWAYRPQRTVDEFQPRTPTPADRTWVEWWLDGNLLETEQMKYESIIQDPRTERALLVVDEYRGELRGTKASRGFDDPKLDFRAFVGLWLTLNATGSRSCYDDIRDRRPSAKENTLDPTLRKCVRATQVALEELVGEPVIPKPRGSHYYIKADSWSWCWIRKNQSREKSILLPIQRARPSTSQDD